MNVGIVTSFTVGGILLLSLLTMNIRMSEFSASSTIDMATKNQIEVITELLENDFRKIGQDLPGSTKPFILMQDDHLKFRADTYFDDNRPFSIITWRFNDNKSYTSSTNPNDFELSRSDNAASGSGNSSLVIPVTHFKVFYLDALGNEVSSLPANQHLVKQVRVEIIMESREPVDIDRDGNDVYTRTMWSKTFYPANLQFMFD